ncbi:leucine-rich repeat domain-containing protein [Flavobacterium lipolyticum]|uniref:Leucine-rich repeat domain-containing protein n=1 Tax=Flavobacterium lipolyticum TaxID=2893754 RepID=A0ABS8M1R2_9FLAO|nr:leucine-rich repeat domain-containing protein [Flavobacterium sp. F-126]MCC9018763.1 leucine-rich repeat domain-containing protein [Flavobacterium sp. F-126]
MKKELKNDDDWVVEDWKDGCRLVRYTGDIEEGSLVIPALIGDKKVYILGTGENIFGPDVESAGLLTLVDISQSVYLQEVGPKAFGGSCDNLVQVFFPTSLVYIGSNAFDDCVALQSIVIPEGVTSVMNNTFELCTSLKEISIPNSVTSIGDSAFFGNYSLPNITIPQSVTFIDANVFYKCLALKSILIPNSVSSIGDSAFLYSGLTEIYLPKKFITAAEEKRIGIPDGANVKETPPSP